MADTRSLAGAMLTDQTAGRSPGSLNPSAREAFTTAYAPARRLPSQNGSGPPPEETDDGPGDTENFYESRCAAPMRTDDTQPEPAYQGPVTK